MSKDDDDEWDGALGEREGDTVSPDMVRKLLAMNPALRNTGMNTASAMNVMAGAKSRADEAPAEAKKGPTGDIFATLAAMKQKLQQERAALEQQQKELDAKKKAVPKAINDSFCNWLGEHDPNVGSPVTQKVLQKEAAFFKEIGFSIDAYIESKMKGKK